MSELFLEEVDQVLDDWAAVRHDGWQRHDAMRWSPDKPRRERFIGTPEMRNLTIEDDGHGAITVSCGDRSYATWCYDPAEDMPLVDDLMNALRSAWEADRADNGAWRAAYLRVADALVVIGRRNRR